MGDEKSKDQRKVPPSRRPGEAPKGYIKVGTKSEGTQNSDYWDWLGHGAGMMYGVWKHVRVHGNRDPWGP